VIFTFKPGILNICIVTMVQLRIVGSLISFALANPAIISDAASLLQQQSLAPNNNHGKAWKKTKNPAGDGTTKKGHGLDGGFLEYQQAMELVDEAELGRSSAQEVLVNLEQDVEFEKQNKVFKQDVVAMWGTRIERLKKLYDTARARYDVSYAALEAKRAKRTEMRVALQALKNAATVENTEQDIAQAEKQIVKIQNLQDVIDDAQTSFRADRAERHSIKLNLRRCEGHKQDAMDGVVQHQKLIDAMIMEYTQNNAPAKLAVLAMKDVEKKARKNAHAMRGRMWSTWKKLRRADLKQKRDVQGARKQSRVAAQKKYKAAAADKSAAVNRAQSKKRQAKVKAEKKVKKARRLSKKQAKKQGKKDAKKPAPVNSKEYGWGL